MPVKLVYFFICVSIGLFAINSCQKDDAGNYNKDISICPEIAMKNYEEAVMIINDFLSSGHKLSMEENFKRLDNYLNECDCIDSVGYNIKSNEKRSYNLRIIFNTDTIYSEMEILVYKNGKLELLKFHQ